MDTQSDLSRISVDSLQDWERIKANYANAALTLLDEQLVGSSSKVKKDTLLKHLNLFVDRTFEMTRPNLRVNGRNFDELDADGQEEEPFDEGFDRHIWALSEQSLRWDNENAEKRREKPAEVENLLKDLLDRRVTLEAEQSALSDDDEPLEAIDDDIPLAAYENIEQVSLQVCAIAEELKQAVPVQAERSERVRTVTAELKALKP
ncbi:hypothetical protein B0H21DRAFT_718909 [Amylocystis lapponica]|nr:hypothetical protein B0H21DRAFT_718909 [Amylocystis lapponica]